MEKPKILKICYFGNDKSYWDKVIRRFESTYSNYQFEFIEISDEKNKTAEDLFIRVSSSHFSVIYIDLSTSPYKKLNLCKYLSKDNLTKLIPTVALHTKEDAKTYFQRSLLSGIRLNHIKCSDMHDVVYDALTFLDVDSTIKPDFVCAEYKYQTQIFQDLRLTYTTDSYFHVETNSPLIEGEELFLEDHFLKKIMRTKLFYIKNESRSNLYYNSRYSFDIYFTYCDDPFDELVEKSEENQDIPDKKFDYHNIITAMEKKELADKQKRIEKDVSKWVLDNNGKNLPKRIKILAIDRKLELFKQLSNRKESFPFNINIQTMLGGNQYQIERLLPHFLIYNMDVFTKSEEDTIKINGIIALKKVIQAVEKIEDYEPIIVVFQSGKGTWDLNSIFEYPKLISNNTELSLDIIQQLGQKLKDKLTSEELAGQNENRVYFKASDDESIIIFKRDIEIISITESIIYFTSEAKIPDWTVFSIKNPVDMLVTVVPHKADGPFYGVNNTYRALVNGAGEIEKQELRTFINQLVEESNKAESSEEAETTGEPT